MLQNPMGAGAGRAGAYYAQAFGTPGGSGSGVPLAAQGAGPSQQTTRQRARSNVDMFPPPQVAQAQPSNISKWQTDVQASQTRGQPPLVVDQRTYRDPDPPQPVYPGGDAPDVPFDPGPRPNFDGVKLSKKQQKAVLVSWQNQKDDFLRYQEAQGKSHKRSKSQTRFAEDQYAEFPRGGVTFPQPGRGSNPNSDVERSMARLTLGGLGPNGANSTAAERQTQRGRRLSGGILGLTGSMAQQQAAQQAAQAQQQQQEHMQRAANERSRSRQPQDRRYMSEDFGSRQGYGGNIANIDHGMSSSQQPTVVPRGAGQYANPYSAQQPVPGGRYTQGNQAQNSPSYAQPISPQEQQHTPYSVQQSVPGGRYVQGHGKQPQRSPSFYTQPIPSQEQQHAPYSVQQSVQPGRYAQAQGNQPQRSPSFYTQPIPSQELQHTPYSAQQSIQPGRYVQAQGNQPQRSPSFYTQPIPSQDPQHTPYSVQQSVQPGRYVQAQGNQPQRSPSFYTQPISPQEPQPSPIYGQPTQPVQIGTAQYSPSQFVPIQVGNVQTTAIPLGHISNYANFPQVLPGLSPLPGTIDLGGQPYMTPTMTGQPSMGYQQDPRTPAKRKTNIAEVMGSAKQQQQQQFPGAGAPYHVDKTLITPTPEEPRHLRKSNISEYIHARHKSEPPTGYVNAAPIPPAEHPTQVTTYAPPSYPPPSHPPPSHRPNLSVSTGGLLTGAQGSSTPTGPPSAQPPVVVRPVMTQNDSASSLPSITGPEGFGNRPSHVRQPSYKAALRDNPQEPVAESPRTEVPIVSMRRPDANMQIKHFDPQVIAYDLNSEHRSKFPMRFGRFVYDRDVNHTEWELFTKQILDTWRERNPAYNYYHTAVKRIQDILMAWNFAFFNPRGMDVVLFKGNERRSGSAFGHPEPSIEFLTEAGRVSEPETSSEDEEHPNHYLMSRAEAQQKAQQIALKEQQRELRRQAKAKAPKQLEAPHSVVIYDIPIPQAQPVEQQGFR